MTVVQGGHAVAPAIDQNASRHPPSVSRRELTFDWKSVNKPIGEKLVSFEGLDLPEHVEVYDLRSGP